MKKVVVLIFSALVVSVIVACAGLGVKNSQKQAASSTLTFGSLITNPQTGRIVKVELETLPFDLYKDRREIVRAVYERCSNPSAKFKEFLANGYDTISLIYTNSNGALTSIPQLECTFNRNAELEKIGKFRVGEYYAFYFGADLHNYDVFKCTEGKIYEDVVKCAKRARKAESDIKKEKGYTLEQIMQKIANENSDYVEFENHRSLDVKRRSAPFIIHYLRLSDIARTEKTAKDNAQSKTIKIIFGEQTINTATGKMGVTELNALEFDIYKGKRELVKAVYEVCSKPNDKMTDFMNAEFKRNGGQMKSLAHISVLYDTQGSGFKEIKTLKCSFLKLGLYQINGVDVTTGKEASTTNLVGRVLNIDFLKSSAASGSELDRIIDDILFGPFNSASFEYVKHKYDFDWEFIQLMDTANGINETTAQSQK